VIEIECGQCGSLPNASVHKTVFDCEDCTAPHEHHAFIVGRVSIMLTPAQAKAFVAQGDDSTFTGNDLLEPIYADLKAALG
jgi:hypothetical protein